MCLAGRPCEPENTRDTGREPFWARSWRRRGRAIVVEALDVGAGGAAIDADTLADSDVRRGCGTPTVLNNTRDLFGMPEPTPPIPSPT